MATDSLRINVMGVFNCLMRKGVRLEPQHYGRVNFIVRVPGKMAAC